MFGDRKAQHARMSDLPNLSYVVNAIPIKIWAGYFVAINKLITKFLMRSKNHNNYTILKAKDNGRNSNEDSELLEKSRHGGRDQWTEHSPAETHKQSADVWQGSTGKTAEKSLQSTLLSQMDIYTQTKWT